MLGSREREILFLVIHNKLSVKEQLFRIGLREDPYCLTCFSAEGAVNCDIEHVMCQCSLVVHVWKDFRLHIELLDPSLSIMSDLDIINLKFPDTMMESEIVWMIGTYLLEAWKFSNENSDNSWQKRNFFGYLKFKYKREAIDLNLRSINSLD